MRSGRSLFINNFHLLSHGPLLLVSKPQEGGGKARKAEWLRLRMCQERSHTSTSGAPNHPPGILGDFLRLQNQETFRVLGLSLASSSHTQPETESRGLDWTATSLGWDLGLGRTQELQRRSMPGQRGTDGDLPPDIGSHLESPDVSVAETRLSGSGDRSPGARSSEGGLSRAEPRENHGRMLSDCKEEPPEEAESALCTPPHLLSAQGAGPHGPIKRLAPKTSASIGQWDPDRKWEGG